MKHQQTIRTATSALITLTIASLISLGYCASRFQSQDSTAKQRHESDCRRTALDSCISSNLRMIYLPAGSCTSLAALEAKPSTDVLRTIGFDSQHDANRVLVLYTLALTAPPTEAFRCITQVADSQSGCVRYAACASMEWIPRDITIEYLSKSLRTTDDP